MTEIFIERVEGLLRVNKITKNKLLQDLGLGKNSFNNWRSRGSEPNASTISAMSHYFGTTVDYLIGLTDDPAPQDEENEETAPLRDALQGSAYMDIIKDMNREERREFAKKFVKFVNENRYMLELIRDTIDQPDSKDN